MHNNPFNRGTLNHDIFAYLKKKVISLQSTDVSAIYVVMCQSRKSWLFKYKIPRMGKKYKYVGSYHPFIEYIETDFFLFAMQA